jgi:hypothetical protein
MARTFWCAFVLSLLTALAACSTTAVESQTKQQDPRQARVYFLRSTMTIGGLAEIIVNGQKVADLANNSSFFIDRDPGQYTISVRSPLETGRFSTTMQLRPATYYVEISQRPEFLAVNAAFGVVGGIIEQSNAPENSGRFKLTVMDQSAGAAMLQKLKQ